jgi:hypothetical protein
VLLARARLHRATELGKGRGAGGSVPEFESDSLWGSSNANLSMGKGRKRPKDFSWCRRCLVILGQHRAVGDFGVPSPPSSRTNIPGRRACCT